LKEHHKSLRWALRFLSPYKGIIVILSSIVIGISLIGMILPLLNKQVIDEGIMKHNLKYTLALIGVSVLLGLLDKGLQLLQANYYAVIASRVPFDIQLKVFKKLLKLRIDFFNSLNATQLLSSLNMDIHNVCIIADHVTIFFVSDLLRVGGSLVGLFLINPLLATLGLLVIPFKIMVNAKLSVKKSAAFSNLIQANQTFSRWFGDALDGVKEIKLLGIKGRIFHQYIERQRPMIQANAKFIRLDQWHNFWDEGLSDWSAEAVFVVGAILVINRGLTLGSLMAFTGYLASVYGPTSAIINLRYTFAGFFSSAQRLEELLNREEEENVKPVMQRVDENKSSSAICFRKVSFTYPDGHLALKKISFNIEPGERVAVIGPNGSGKTTIINLILGLHCADAGAVDIFGKPIERIPLKKLRQIVAAVTQDSYLFDATIQDNIDLCKNQSNNNVISIRIKELTDLLKEFPMGLDTPVGRNGIKISGGQRQRIAIARALIRNSSIILMDEATSQLDIDSEREINQLVCNLPRNVTTMIITHRPYILERVDKIIVMDDGEIAAVGKHDQLIHSAGFYQQILKAHDWR
jgi:ATP-binding cassette subfamily B protein